MGDGGRRFWQTKLKDFDFVHIIDLGFLRGVSCKGDLIVTMFSILAPAYAMVS